MTEASGVPLRGRDPWLDHQIDEFAHWGEHLWKLGCVPGNGGDMSILIPEEVQETLEASVDGPALDLPFSRIHDLALVRRDRRPYYRAEAVDSRLLSEAGIQRLAGRAIIATVSGGKVWDLARNERHLCMIAVGQGGETFRVLYGNREHGTVPTTEFVNHLIAHATNAEIHRASVVVHVHPQNMIDLSRHPAASVYAGLNRVLYAQRPELLANVPELVGLVPYRPPGSAALVSATLDAVRKHRVVLWAGHGVLIREASLERCVDLLEYVETSAHAVLRNLMLGGVLRTMSPEEMRAFVDAYGLSSRVLELFENR
jgi:rhamnulose-1-phosphate aldolase